MSLKEDAFAATGVEIRNDTATLQKYAEDASVFHVEPEAVAYPRTVKELGDLVRYVSRHDGVSLTARSAGTCMSGGPLTRSMVVDFLAHFNKVIEVGDGYAITQPGVFYRDFEKETLKKGYLLPCYTASRELNTVGGMVGNNSAGEKTLTFGQTKDFVEKLKVVLKDGNEYEFGPLTPGELEAKKSLDTFEGGVYKRMHELIAANKGTIDAARPRVSKNSTGYLLWDVMRPDGTFDLSKIFVGSQGTLGLTTEIKFRLIKPKKHSRLVVAFLHQKHMKVLGDMVNALLAHKPESFESYDDHTFYIILQTLPQLFARLKTGIIPFGFSFMPEIKATVTGGIPKLVLLAEFTADTEEEAQKNAYAAQKAYAPFGVQTYVTRSEKEAEKYWTIRRESFNLLRGKVGKKHTAPFIDDIIVAPEKLPVFLPKLYEIMGHYKITYTIAGHIGNGNFHIIPLMDFTRPDFLPTLQALSEDVYDLVFTMEGSMSGEHNDGLIRTGYLPRMYRPEVVKLFAEVKNIFDPGRIFNPHKKVDPLPDVLRAFVKHH